MIIWSGHGILIPFFGILGGLLGTGLGAYISNLLGKPESGTIGFLIAVWGAWLGVFLYGKTIGKTKTDVLLDPRTMQQVVQKRRHTLFFIPARGWTWIAGLNAVMLSIVFITTDDAGPTASGPGASELKAAEKQIFAHKGTIAFGNTSEAVKLAEEFSTNLKTMRRIAISSSGKRSTSLSDGYFLTYCQISQHGIAFMVHVPDLRNFTQEAKDFITDTAKELAIELASESPTAPKLVGVAVRGSLLYESVTVTQLSTYGKAEPRVIDSGKDEKILLPFFAAPAATASKTPVLASNEPKETPENEPAPAPKEEAPSPAPTPTPAPAPTPAPTPAPAPVASAPAPAAEALTLPTAMRTWKSSDNRPLEASLVRFVSEAPLTGEFKRPDGSVFTIPAERFSAEDQKLLRDLAPKGAQ